MAISFAVHWRTEMNRNPLKQPCSLVTIPFCSILDHKSGLWPRFCNLENARYRLSNYNFIQLALIIMARRTRRVLKHWSFTRNWQKSLDEHGSFFPKWNKEKITWLSLFIIFAYFHCHRNVSYAERFEVVFLDRRRKPHEAFSTVTYGKGSFNWALCLLFPDFWDMFWFRNDINRLVKVDQLKLSVFFWTMINGEKENPGSLNAQIWIYKAITNVTCGIFANSVHFWQ